MDMRLEKLPVPNLYEDEVLIKVYDIGVSGFDIYYYEHGKQVVMK